MRLFFAFLIAATVGQAGFVSAAGVQEAGVYVVTYLDVTPPAVEAVMTAFRAEVAASSADEGCEGVQVLSELGRSDRFVILEMWKDQAAFAAHSKAPHVKKFRDQLGEMQTAPPDQRVLSALWLSPVSKTVPKDAFWVITHVDVPPPHKDEASTMLRDLGEESAQQSGNLRFGIVQQKDRPNHFTVGEIWADPASFEAHQAAAPTRQFRDKLAPMLGALYDQRLYRALQ